MLAIYNSYAQLKIISNNASNYPKLELEFLAFDSTDKIMTVIPTNLITINDNSNQFEPIEIYCEPFQPQKLSLLISLDLAISDDLAKPNFHKAKSLTYEIFKLATQRNECALSGFDNLSYIFSDFTTNLIQLENSLLRLNRSRGSYFNAGLLSKPAGAIELIKDKPGNKIILLITDASSSADKDSIVKLLNQYQIKLFVVSLSQYLSDDIKDAVIASGGKYFVNILDGYDLSLWAKVIYAYLNNYSPCKLFYETQHSCDDIHKVIMSISKFNISDSITYKPPKEKLTHIKPTPEFLSFGGVLPPAYKEINISLMAENDDIIIDSIVVKDWHFSISSGISENIYIPANTEHLIRLRFTPSDSTLIFTKLIIYSSNSCYGNEIPITAGFPNTIPYQRTIKIENPKCSDKLIVGDTVMIEWSGILPKDVVQLEFSTNNGATWDTLVYDINGLKYEWIVPDKVSDSCLIRIIQLWPNNIGRTMDLPHNGGVNSAMFNSDETLVVTASQDLTARVWNANNGRELIRLVGHTKPVLWAEFNHNDKLIATGSQDSTIIIWDANNGSIIKRLYAHQDEVRAVRFHPFKDTIVSVSKDGYVFEWDLLSGRIIDTIDYSPIHQWFADYSNNGELLAISGNDRNVKIYNLVTRRFEKIFDTGIVQQGLGINVHCAFSPDDKRLATSSWFGKSIIWDIESGDTLATVEHIDSSGSNSAIFFASFDYTSDTLLTSGFEHKSIMWHAPTGKYIATLQEHRSSVKTGIFNFDGMRVLTSSFDSTAKLWNRGKRDIQMDTIACPFQITRAKIIAKDIDFGQVALADVVDTSVTAFIVNQTNAPITIRELKIEGISRNDFTILSNFAPFTLNSNEEYALEIRFRPLNQGVRLAKIKIVIPNETIYVNLTGEGYQTDLQTFIKFIDFGEVVIGEHKDTTINPLLKNRFFDQIRIDSIVFSQPEDYHFKMLNVSFPIKLNPDDNFPLSLRFIPDSNTLFYSTLNIYSNGRGSPNKIPVIGKGINPVIDTVLIAVVSSVGKPGEIIEIPLICKNPSGKELSDSFRGILADCSFNSTLLEPIGSEILNDYIDGTIRTITLKLPYNKENDTLLGKIKFKVGLGNDSITQIKILNSKPIHSERIHIIEHSGKFKLDGICSEGGSRLFDSEGMLFLSQNHPNPFSDETNISFGVIEKGFTRLLLFDLYGNLEKVVFANYLEPGEYDISIKSENLNSGLYFYVLQTPTQVIKKKLVIIK